MSNWAYEGALQHARESLAERFPGEEIEIVDTLDVAWSGGDGDDECALITRNGTPELVIVNPIGGLPVEEILVQRLAEYRRLIADTEAVLKKYRSMGGLDNAEEMAGFARLDAGLGVDADEMLAKARTIVSEARRRKETGNGES